MLKFGLAIPTLTAFPRASETGREATRERYARSYALCERAEHYGFDFATIGHHRFTPETIDSSAPLVTLAALAARTSKLRLCTNILLVAAYDPIQVAEQVAMLDEISDGRAILGVGLGYRPYEFLGVDYKSRASRLEESVAMLRQAWAGLPVQFHGRHFDVSGPDVAPKPLQPGGPPIWFGAQAEAAVMRAARLADGWIADNIQTLRRLGPQAERFRAAAREAGRSPEIVLIRKVGIGRTRAQVEQEWLPEILAAIRKYISDGVAFQDKEFEAKLLSGRRLTLRDLPPDLFVAGTPEDCIEQIRNCKTTLECDYLIADFGRAAHGTEYQMIEAMFDLFGREVVSVRQDAF